MKNLLYTMLGLIGIMGTLSIGVVNASTYNIETQNPGWTYGTISIARPDGVTDNGPAGFTIMDRNLGATTNEVNTTYGSYTNGTGSYGYHYQWGNNYGFAQGCTISSKLGSCNDDVTANPTGLEWNTDYNNSGYYSTDFINGSNLDYDVWSDSSHHDGVWGGAGDNASNNRGANEDNPTDRQGPCPLGYHVPSAGEWGLLIKYWAYASGYDSLVVGDEGLYYISSGTARTDFMDYFKLPFAGKRNYYNASLYGQGSDGIYWSSSPYGSDIPNVARSLSLNSSYVRASDSDDPASGFSVRCFKDTYEAPTTYTLTFDSQGGDEVVTGVAVENTSRSRPENPTKSGYTFVDWYTTTGYETAFDFTGTLATGNLTVYAKWHDDRCGDDLSLDYDEENKLCYKKDTTHTVPVYYGIDKDPSHSYNDNPIGTITVKLPDGNILTMMDMNLGATVSGTTCNTTETGACGDYFQWGNNTAFSSSPNITTTSNPELFTGTQATYENYRPGHPYNSELFRYGPSMYDYRNEVKVGDNTQQNFDNLWGGLGDMEITTNIDTFWGGVNNGDTRQGPCPSGYHVPSAGEWNALTTYWYNANNPTATQKSYTSLNNINGYGSYSFSESFRTVFKLPLAGLRDLYDASIEYQGSFGDYWSSSPNLEIGSQSSASYLNIQKSEVFQTYADMARGYGKSVRCFKDSPKASETLILTFQENGGDLLGATGEDGVGTLIQKVASGHLAQQPVNPTKIGATFQRWTEEGDEDIAFDFSSPITSSITLKAIYSCNTGYQEVDGECIQPFTVTIAVNNPDFGSVDSGLVVAFSGTVISTVSNPLTIGTVNVTATPSMSGDQYSYNFVDWTNECGELLTADCTITGNFSQTTNEYEITWKDGNTILRTDNIAYGSIPNYGPVPTKTNYVFDAWDPVPEEVIGDAVYIATWKVDINNNGVADEDETYTLTINYEYSRGGTATGSYIENVLSGANYNVISPTVDYYKTTDMTVVGIMPGENKTITVIYTPITDKNNNGIADEDEDHFTLTIHYVNSKGAEVFPDYTGSYVSGANYSVDSQAKEHYTINKATISGVMGNSDVEETVTYSTETEDTNDNGIADEDEDHFTLTIHYVNSKGGTVFEDYTGSYVSGASYNIASTEKEHYTIDKATVSGVMPNENHEETVVYTPNNDKNNNGIADEDEPSSGGGSSGGGGSSKKPSDSGKTTEGGKLNNVDNDKNTENVIQSETKGSEESSNTPMDSSANASEGQTYTQEFQEAYEFAYNNGITTMPTIQKANMNGKLTRIAMAKMLSYYAINILGQKPDKTRINKFNDITEKLDTQYDNGVTLAYQLGIMGVNMPNNNFRPNDEVTRAEFTTALSRMLYSTPDGKPYYSTHLDKLKVEGIITNDDYRMKELRGYVMIMLMRSAK